MLSKIKESKSGTLKNLLMVLVKDVAKYINLLDTKSDVPKTKELDFYCQRQFVSIIYNHLTTNMQIIYKVASQDFLQWTHELFGNI